MSECAQINISVRLDNKDAPAMKLIFEEGVLSNIDFKIVNAPNCREFEYIRKKCAVVVVSIVSRWVDPNAGIQGIQAIQVQRHTLTIEKADAKAFKWSSMFSQLYPAIRQAYPNSYINFRNSEDDAANQVVDSTLEARKTRSNQELLLEVVLPEIFAFSA